MKRIVALALAAVLLLAGCVEDSKTVSEIGMDEARSIALADAGVDAAQLESVASELSERDGIRYYDVSFSTGEVVYEYDVDALTGVIIVSEYAKIVTIEDGTALAEPSSEPSQTPPVEQLDAALDGVDVPVSAAPDAAVSPTPDPTDPFCTTPVPPTPDPSAEPTAAPVYIMEVSSEPRGDGTFSVELAVAHISKQRAKEIALAQVKGATTGDIYDFEIDYDDGRLEYEGKIIYDEMEYEFEIDGYSGAIRSWEVESIYD